MSIYTPNENVENCGSRLPCGLCMITQSPCPMQIHTFYPTCTASTVRVTGSDETYSNYTFCKGGSNDD